MKSLIASLCSRNGWRGLLFSLAGILCLLAVATPVSGQVDRSKAKDAIDRGANWLIDQQREDGSYGSYRGDVGITAIVLRALADCPRGYREEDGPFISSAIQYLLNNRQPDGGIFETDQGLMNYKTSMSLMALAAIDSGREKPVYGEVIANARDFITSLQLAEDTKPIAYDPQRNLRAYGGIGYGGDRRPDLSNTQIAIQALRAANLAEDSDVYLRARKFLSRCQNRNESNDFLDGANHRSTEDGGFFYYPGESKAQNLQNEDGSRSYTSYGSMTYAGVKSLIYSGVDREDPRVQAALKWIADNYTVSENPGMATKDNRSRGQMGVFYYYEVMARTLSAVGESVIVDSAGTQHNWAKELAQELISRQREDGSWVNPVDRWWEGDPVLVTAYAVEALSICRKYLED